MPEAKRPLKVFLCHAHADRDAVRALYTRLTNDGVDAWLDKEKLLGGADWEYEIRTAVRESDIVIVCHSNQFNQRGFRQKEVKIALEEADLLPKGEIFIIPIRLEECDVLDDLKRWHWVDLFESDGYERLMRTLRARADKIGVTLQVKKSWLPKVVTSRKNAEKSVGVVVNEGEKQETAEKIAQEKSQKEFEREAKKIIDKYDREKKKIINQHKWKKFLSNIRYKLAIIRIYSVPLLFFIPAIALLVFYLFDLQERIPFLSQDVKQTRIPDEVFPAAETITPTSITTSTATSQPTEITDDNGVAMILVPAGEFYMGSAIGNLDEQPIHKVYLDAFYIYKFEVSNKNYVDCIGAGVCDNPTNSSRTFLLDYQAYPVSFVTWNQAQNYCKWLNARLPTEAEWEKAAKLHESINFLPTNVNLKEWVLDWYSETYYQDSSYSNPQGPDSGFYRVIRGGYDQNSLQVSDRDKHLSIYSASDVGFRCAKDAP